MRAKLVLLLVGVACAVVLAMAQDSSALIYKYMDEDGLVNFADDLQAIPEQFRSSAKIVGGNPEEEKRPEQQEKPGLQPSAPPVIDTPSPEPQAPPQHSERSPLSRRVLVSIIVVVSILFAFSILGILDEDHKKAVKIARVIMLWGLSVYLLYAHAMDVVRLTGLLSGNVASAQRASEEKGKKMAEKVKKFDAFMDQLDKTMAENPETEPEGSKDK